MSSPILDVACGSRMFWFDKSDPRCIFMDCRQESHSLKDSTSKHGSRPLVIAPDVVGDFTAIPYPDGSFNLVCFDPPHFTSLGDRSWMARKYGKLPEDWRDLITKGFAECFRVLRPGGTLVFKWNEAEIPVSQILALTPESPLFGNVCGKFSKTHWLVFMKDWPIPIEVPEVPK